MRKVIIGEKYIEKLRKPLLNLGFECIMLQNNQKIANQVSSHADMSIINLKNGLWVVDRNILPPIKAIKSKKALSQKYPENIGLNALIIGNHFFHNLKYTDERILENLDKNMILHNVKQGYTNCSVLVLRENLCITSDKSIYDELIKTEINTLLIKSGGISLLGYDYGFIGGCGFMIDKNTLCLTGKLEKHESFEQIKKFLYEYNINILYLTNEVIFDIGGILEI